MRMAISNARERLYPGSVSREAESLRDSLDLLDDFLASPAPRGRSKARSWMHQNISDNAMIEIGSLLSVVSGELDDVSAAYAARRILEWVRQEGRELQRTLGPELADEAAAQLRNVQERADFLLQINQLSSVASQLTHQQASASEVLERAEESASSVQELVSDAAASELGGEFARHARREEVQSFGWSAVVVVALVVVCLISVRLLGAADGLEWVGQLSRLAATLPIVGIAVYAARVAAHHRANAHWARTNAVQLKSIPAYTDVLDDARRSDLRFEFGRRIFGGSTSQLDEATPLLVDPAALLQQASEVMKAAAELVKSAKKQAG